VEEIIETHQRLWTHEATEKTNGVAILQILLPKIFRVKEYFNLRDDRLVNERLSEAMGEHTFENTKIPLFISATEYKTGKQVIISKGSIYEAVRATIALPLIFPPIQKDEQLLADGYLSEPLPIGVAVKEGANIILAMGFESISTEERNSISDYLLHLSGILSNNLLQASYAFYNLAHHAEVISIVPQFEEDIHMFDTHKVPEIIKAGEAEGEKVLPELKQVLGMSP
ncbi:MAG: patatin-like phospholipase family protein, partial [Deltaproteobacteria bacterium]|nr:patatin-like phospholipase family protein [Deltaproteobacteria bacterium]